MVSKECRTKIREKKHMKIRNRFSGTPERPRLAVFRSNNHMYAQIIDDTVGHTLVAASTLEKDVKADLEKTNDVAAAAKLGTVIAQRAIEKGIKTVVYDRDSHLLIGIMRDITDEEAEREKKENISRQTVEVADKVVEKQMRIVQEIASLLGETAAETKIALSKLKESISDE